MPQHLTVGHLLRRLQDLDPTLPIRLAVNPDWPFTHYVGAEVAVRDGKAFIADDGQENYLHPSVRNALSWSCPLSSPLHPGGFHLATKSPAARPRRSPHAGRRPRRAHPARLSSVRRSARRHLASRQRPEAPSRPHPPPLGARFPRRLERQRPPGPGHHRGAPHLLARRPGRLAAPGPSDPPRGDRPLRSPRGRDQRPRPLEPDPGPVRQAHQAASGRPGRGGFVVPSRPRVRTLIPDEQGGRRGRPARSGGTRRLPPTWASASRPPAAAEAGAACPLPTTQPCRTSPAGSRPRSRDGSRSAGASAATCATHRLPQPRSLLRKHHEAPSHRNLRGHRRWRGHRRRRRCPGHFLRRPEITAPTVRHRGLGRGRAITSCGSGTDHPAARSPDTSGPGPGARLQPRC